MRPQRPLVHHALIEAGKVDRCQLVASTLFNGNFNVDALAGGRVHREDVDAAGVAHLGDGIARLDLEVALLAVRGAHALHVFIQLGRVKCAREQVLKNDGVRNADGLGVLHGRAQRAAVDALVALKADLADLNRRTFLDDERDRNARRWNRLDFGADGSELVAVLGQQLLQHDFLALDAGRVVLALHRDADLGLLVALQHVRLRDRVQALVVDLADGRLLAHIDDELRATRAFRPLDPHVLKVAGIPQRVEIALDRGLVVRIAGTREQPRQDRLLRIAAVADHLRSAQRLGRGRSGHRQGLRMQRGGIAQGRRQNSRGKHAAAADDATNSS